MKKLRLLFTPVCNRACPGCCNKDWELNKLPKVDHFDYDIIMITGGEPLLYVPELIGYIKAIRAVSKAKIYIYTARVPARANNALYEIIPYVDGVTLTLHNQNDAAQFTHVLDFMENDRQTQEDFKGKSLRLNVFEGIELSPDYNSLAQWVIKSDMVWIKNCPLPPDEEFKQI